MELELKAKIADDLLGTAQSIADILQKYGLAFSDLEELEHYLSENSVVECEKCGTWCNDAELADEHNHGVKHCAECRCYDCEDY